MKRKILIIDGNPNPESFGRALGDSYFQGAQEGHFDVIKVSLRDLKFDLNLRQGYSSIQELEPDLVDIQEKIKWCQHLVMIYPIWWGSMPALVKGFLDRCWLPGFSFKYHKNSPFWDRLLAGRTARIIVTSDAPTLYNFFVYFNAPVIIMKKTILGFCGFKPIRVTAIGSVKNLNITERKKNLDRARKLGLLGR
jgi:NAD(P)H dehydrogenase (quinone)